MGHLNDSTPPLPPDTPVTTSPDWIMITFRCGHTTGAVLAGFSPQTTREIRDHCARLLCGDCAEHAEEQA